MKGYIRKESCKSKCKKEEKYVAVDENSPVIKDFSIYASELDSKHDKLERIVKLSRDVTIESKRIIFLLHTANDKQSDKKEEILDLAFSRINALTLGSLKSLALELHSEDPYQYLRGFSSGIQEFVEAITFYYYLKTDYLQTCDEIQSELIYNSNDEKNKSTEDENPKTIDDVSSALITQTDYILGVADLTGELMKKCVVDLTAGHLDSCYKTRDFVRNVYRGFLGISFFGSKELSRKVYVLKQSLNKIENVCYAIHMRGSEVPKYMLADVISSTGENQEIEDEGFF